MMATPTAELIADYVFWTTLVYSTEQWAAHYPLINGTKPSAYQ